MENYLKVIFEVLEHEDRAATSTIAVRMGIAAPSVTAMLKRLDDLGLVSHEPYRGVRLTEVGEKMALEIVRHHRLIELYLAEALGVPRNYLSKILHQLARSGVLASARGPHGGFQLAAPPAAISLAEVVGAVEPQRFERRCLLGRPECSDANPCPAHDSWQVLAEGISCFLHETTLEVYATQPVYASLVAHMLNNEVYSNFLEKPAGNPTIRFNILEPGRTDTIGGYSVLPLPVNHAKPTTGFEITSPGGETVFYTSDTGPGLADIWRQVSPQLLVIETTASDRYQKFALETGHLTPSLLRRELVSFRDIKGYLPQTVLVHMNPREEAQLEKEIAEVATALQADISIGCEGMRIHI